MKIAGIIAEFNPFHNGHRRLISLAREQAGAELVVVIMSGNFVQRGIPAFLEKRFRTQIALENGADVVLELPVRYATGSAPVFARGAVAGLLTLNCLNTLVFGSETESGILSALAEAERSLEDSQEFSSYVKEQSRKGVSYPKIRQDFLLTHLPKTLDKKACIQALSTPNSILGIEYLKALSYFGSRLSIHAVRRNDAGYHSTNKNVFCSATALRRQFLSQDFPDKGLPENSIPLLKEQYQKSFPVLPSDFDLVLYDRLLSLDSSDFSRFQDIDPDSAERFYKNIRNYQGYESFAALCSQKQKTVTRTLRMLCHLLLRIPQFYPEALPPQTGNPDKNTCSFQKSSTASGTFHKPQYQIQKKNTPEHWCPYLRLLGMKKEASLCLRKASVPVISKLAAAEAMFPDGQLPKMLCEDIYAARLYQQAIRTHYGKELTDEYKTGPVVLP